MPEGSIWAPYNAAFAVEGGISQGYVRGQGMYAVSVFGAVANVRCFAGVLYLKMPYVLDFQRHPPSQMQVTVEIVELCQWVLLQRLLGN